MGTAKVKVRIPENSTYESPMMYTADVGNPTNSGQTHVEGWAFSWDSAEGGFINTGWWGTELTDGPTRIGGFENENSVQEHIRNGGNLDAAFAAWQSYLDGLEDLSLIAFNHFTNKLIELGGSGCATHMG